MAPFRVLSLDGGGIRGIVPALILAELERRTARPVARLFDLIAGTSTGGILALGLVRPGGDGRPAHTARSMVELYRRDGPRIFARSPLHRLAAVGNLLEEKYPSRGVDDVLAAHFEQSMLSQALTPVFVTAYDIEERAPYFFKSHRATKDPRRDHLMRDAARATSAAPTYFEPAKIPSQDARGYKALVDGGVYANNPAACAIVESLCEFGAKLEDVVLLSLGTGELTRPIRYQDACRWGLANWAQPVLNVVFDGVSDTVNYQVQSLLTRGGALDHYLRIQPTLTDANDDMDDASVANLARLEELARQMIEGNDAGLDAMAALLTAAGPAAGTAGAGVAAGQPAPAPPPQPVGPPA
jgi:patatin-like phospholipase/acyl hydrolase